VKRKFLTSILAVIVACTAMLGVPVTTVADTALPVYLDGDTLFKTKMYLGAWCEPEGTEEQVAYFADCGYNVVYLKHQSGYNSTNMHHYLDLLDKYGIKAMVGDCARTSGTSWRSSRYSLDHSAFLGAYGNDEPLGTGTREKINGVSNPKFIGTMYYELAPDRMSTVYSEQFPYFTLYDYLYYDGMTFLYGIDESQFFIDGVTNVGIPDEEKTVPVVSQYQSPNNLGGYRIGTNSDAYKAYTGSTDEHFQRLFTSVISNQSKEGFGYESLKSYCESVLTGKHDITMSADDTIPVPVDDRFIEIDIYPYSIDDRTGEIKIAEKVLNRLMEFRYYIDAYDVPMSNVYYQNWFVDALLPYIDESVLTQQFYTIMSYGIKGLTVWYYNMYWTDFHTDNEVMVDEWLQRTELWYYNKAAFDEVKQFDHVYLQFCDPDKWQGIMTINGTEHSTGAEGMFKNILEWPYTFGRPTDSYDVFDYEGSTMTPAEAKAFAEGYVANHYFNENNLYEGIEGVSATGDATIGIMKDNNDNVGYVITNQNFVIDRIENDVTVDFKGASRAMVWLGGEYQLVDLDNGVLRLHLGVGDGAFVIPVK